MDLEELARRLNDLEGRVQRLEGGGPESNPALPETVGTSQVVEPHYTDRALSVVEVSVSNKRYQPTNPHAGVYEDAMWFDLLLSLRSSEKPTRAVKGVLEFCDLFGEPRFVIEYTVTEPMQPGRARSAPGIGFSFNEFMPDHKWMYGTQLNDMLCRYRVRQIIYLDGSSESLY